MEQKELKIEIKAIDHFLSDSIISDRGIQTEQLLACKIQSMAKEKKLVSTICVCYGAQRVAGKMALSTRTRAAHPLNS